MAKYIECRNCDSPYCDGCNIYSLATMLNNGKFDCLMNNNHSINCSANVVSRAVFEQVKWERDTALATLEEHGIGFAQKVDVVEVVHGKWEFNRGQAYGEPLYFCSVCTDGGSEWGKDKYCPNCGAKMDGDKNG